MDLIIRENIVYDNIKIEYIIDQEYGAWFCVTTVLQILGFRTHLLNQLIESKYLKTYDNSHHQNIFISELGLYKLLSNSKSQIFSEWVYNVAMKSIRIDLSQKKDDELSDTSVNEFDFDQ